MHTFRIFLLVVVAIVIVACSGAGPASPSPSGAPSPGGSPSPSPAVGAIDHPTGATDILLRYEEGGGLMMPAFVVVQAPQFTLYGDGTIVFRPPAPDVLGEPENGVFKEVPFRTARLSEEQAQELLEFAIGEGGLGLAVKDQYDNPMVADASTATFTIRAGDLDKKVNVYALGLDAADVPDRAIRAMFGRLAERLRAVDQGGSLPSEPYQPHAFRGVLMDGAGMQGAAPIDWPWPEIGVADFSMPGDEEGPAFPSRVMTPAEIAATSVTGGEGGFQGLLINGPDGKVYSFAARPLLPDDES